jgi:hypothetical protein
MGVEETVAASNQTLEMITPILTTPPILPSHPSFFLSPSLFSTHIVFRLNVSACREQCFGGVRVAVMSSLQECREATL